VDAQPTKPTDPNKTKLNNFIYPPVDLLSYQVFLVFKQSIYKFNKFSEFKAFAVFDGVLCRPFLTLRGLGTG
jgi:hypothetical protein